MKWNKWFTPKTSSNSEPPASGGESPGEEKNDLKGRVCPHCLKPSEWETLKQNLYVCPFCQQYFRLLSGERIAITFDKDSFEELFVQVVPQNIIDFPGYSQKLRESQEKSQQSEAIVVGQAKLHQMPVAAGVMSFHFVGGSMGRVVGDRLINMLFYAIQNDLPVVIFTASGGARVQEGIFSLMQMARTSMALSMLEKARLPLFVVLTDPTYGGVTASFGMLGDVILAEKEATVGFAGRRVIEGTIRGELPEHFQTAEFLQQSGYIDKVVERQELRNTLALLLSFYAKR